MPAIDIASEIQQVHLEVRAAIALDGRPHANVGNPRPALAVQLGADHEHPGERHATALELHVGGRRAELAGQFLAVQDASFDLERPPQQVLGQGEVGLGQGLAHARAADPFAGHLDGRRRFDGEAFARSDLAEEIEITGTVAAEAEIVADFQVLDAQPLDQHRVDELGGAQLAQAAVETQAQHPVDAFAGQQLELVAQAGQPRWRGVRAEVFAWLRLEDHHATRHPELGRALAQTRQDGLVAPVYAVEIADGGDAAPMPGP
ncbi:hypothetical protein D9M70_433370 [compost metagenome]